MKPLNNFISFIIIGILLLTQQTCIGADSDKQSKQAEINSNLISRAKQVTTKLKLSELKLECLSFEVTEEKFEGNAMIDVREVHGGNCGGDPQTSPRAFSIAIDNKSGDVWSDAKSMVTQMELVGKE